jgi:hypothetical protein
MENVKVSAVFVVVIVIRLSLTVDAYPMVPSFENIYLEKISTKFHLYRPRPDHVKPAETTTTTTKTTTMTPTTMTTMTTMTPTTTTTMMLEAKTSTLPNSESPTFDDALKKQNFEPSLPRETKKIKVKSATVKEVRSSKHLKSSQRKTDIETTADVLRRYVRL